jgi:hypothetical protein
MIKNIEKSIIEITSLEKCKVFGSDLFNNHLSASSIFKIILSLEKLVSIEFKIISKLL